MVETKKCVDFVTVDGSKGAQAQRQSNSQIIWALLFVTLLCLLIIAFVARAYEIVLRLRHQVRS